MKEKCPKLDLRTCMGTRGTREECPRKGRGGGVKDVPYLRESAYIYNKSP